MTELRSGIPEQIVQSEPDASALSELISGDMVVASLAKRLAISRSTRRQPYRPQQLEALRKAYRDGRIVFVLGAGVSRDYRLPDWNTLLQKLMLTSIEQQTRETPERATVLARVFTNLFLANPLIAARYLATAYQNRKGPEVVKSPGTITGPVKEYTFEEAVRTAIYAEVMDSHQSELIKEIRRYCIAPGKSPSIDSIITYNYDDLVERALGEIDLDVRFVSIYDVGMNPAAGELPIYHVHGYLPRDGQLGDQHRITLSEDYYHKQYSDIYSWNNIVQINKFRDNVCVFIGTSFTDPNLRRLLDIARTQRGGQDLQHFMFRKQYDPTTIATRLTTLVNESREFGDSLDGAELDVSKTVEHLIQIAEAFEEDDDRSFGVSTVWLDHYDQIPEILADVRRSSHTDKRTRPAHPS